MASIERPDGCRLYLETHGERDAPALILLEGLGGDIPGWRRNVPTLSKELRVIAYDFRGNGNSDDPPGACTMETFVEDTCAVLDAVGAERAHVYGQSFGGMVAQAMGLERRGRVRTLILAATHPGGSRAVHRRAKVPITEPWQALYSPAFVAEHSERVVGDLRARGSRSEHPQGGRRQWEAMQAFDAYDRLREITAPTLVMHGTEDRTVDPENARILASAIPGAELSWLEGAGHLYNFEQAEAADREVLDFVRRHADA